MPTDTKLNNLVINYLTQEQYDAIESPNENELYLTPDNSTGGGGIQTIGATASLDETDGSIKLTMDSAPSGEMFVLSFGEESGLVNALMVRDVNGNYYGCSNDGDTTTYVYVFIRADGTGLAFDYYSGFLYSQKEQTEGNVLTIQNKRAQWTTTPRYEHTITIKTSAGAILWTQTMRNSSNTIVNSYANLKTLFGEATYAGFGEYCQLDLHGGTEATDKLIKADGTEVTLASLGAIVYADDCFLPK